MNKLIKIIQDFFVTSTDSIVADMNKAIDRLENHSNRLAVMAEDHHAAADAWRTRGNQLEDEAERASRVRDNLAAILK